MKKYFVTAIGTDSGKTLISAILCEALGADYWKPIQSGPPADTDTVRGLVSNPATQYHPEAYRLKTPASPHAAAAIDGVQVSLDAIQPPATSNRLIMEGAGGILVPLNDTDFVIDVAARCADEVILVSNLYLGNINHTLLSVHYLKAHHLPVKGIIFNGPPNEASESIILHHAGYPCLLRVPQLPHVNPTVVTHYANILKDNWND